MKIWIQLILILMLLSGGPGCEKSNKGQGGPVTPTPPPGTTPIIPQGSIEMWQGKLTITDKGAYEKFIENFLLVCDRGLMINFQTTPDGNFVDLEDCDTHKTRAYVTIFGYGGASYYITWSAGYHAYYEWFDFERERSFQAGFYPINNSQGFSLVASDITGGFLTSQSYNRFHMDVEDGTIEDETINDISFYYEGEVFATARKLDSGLSY